MVLIRAENEKLMQYLGGDGVIMQSFLEACNALQ